MSLEPNLAALVAASTKLTKSITMPLSVVNGKRDAATTAQADITAAETAIAAASATATTDAATTASKLTAAAADYAAQKTTKGLAAVQTSAYSELKDRLHRRDPARHPFRGAVPSLVMDFVRRECHRANSAGNLEQVDLSSFMTFTRASTATYTGPDGLIKTAAANEPRYDYDPVTGECKGLLIEEQRTNLLSGSVERLYLWDLVLADPIRSTILSPGGKLDAFKLTERQVSPAPEYYMRSITGTSGGAGQVFCASVYVHTSSERSPCLRVTHISCASPTTEVTFNISQRTFSRSSGYITSTGFADAGNGWLRIWVVYTLPTASVTEWGLNLQGGTTTGDGVSGVVMYGPQLEVGSFPTSYIPTPATFTGRASTKTYFDSNGVLQTAASGVAVTDYGYVDGRWVSKGLSLEPQATNLLTNGQGAGVATATSCPTNWTVDQMFGGNIGVSAASSVTTALGYGAFRFSINGTTTATNRLLISPTNVHPGVASATTYTFAYITRLVAGTLPTKLQPVFMWYDNAGALLSRSNGTEITPTTTETRYTTTVTSAVNAAFVRILFDFTGYDTIGLVVNFTLDLGGLQFETGPVATSYIPTTTAQVTRAADTSTSAQATRGEDKVSTSTAGWGSPNDYTLRCNAAIDGLGGSVFPGLFDLTTGVGGYRMGVFIADGDSDDCNIKVVDPTYAGVQTSTYTTEQKRTLFSFGVRKLGSVYTGSRNGGSLVSPITKQIKPATTLYLGIFDYNLNGVIRSFTYFPRALSDTDLQALTILEN